MELQHSFTVPADVEVAWAALLDLEGVAPCFPGATLLGTDGDEFTGQVKVKFGPVSLQYAGKGRFVERDDAAHRAVIEAHGSDKRGNGTAGATVVAQLTQEGEQTTRVTVDTQLKVTGRPAQFGRGVMQDVGSRIVDQFASQLAQRLAGDVAAQSQPATPAAVPTPAVPTPAVPTPAVPTPAVPTPAVPTPPAAQAERPVAPPPAPRSVGTAGTAGTELDLNAVVLPVLARQYGPTVLAMILTAIVTLLIARRRR